MNTTSETPSGERCQHCYDSLTVDANNTPRNVRNRSLYCLPGDTDVRHKLMPRINERA